jgi:hypothetical protein
MLQPERSISVIIHECEQGGAAWHAARCGVITASMFGIIRAKVGMLDERQRVYVQAILEGEDSKAALLKAGYKATPSAASIAEALQRKTLEVGDWSDAAKNYAFRLACERISGEPLGDTSETFAMRRGRELEEACRKRHEKDIGIAVDLAGFITTEDRKFGCSADSLVDPDGGGEYKAFYAAEKVRPILTADDWGDVQDQVQGCIWLTGRKFWDQCLYFPALASVGKDYTRRRVTRDDNYIDALEADLIDFDRLVCEWEAVLRQDRKQELAA